MFACTDSGTLFNTFAVLCTQHRWCRVPGKTSVHRLPEAEPTVADGYFRGDPQPALLHLDQELTPALRALGQAPTWKPTSSLLPSGVAPISTSMHSALSSILACK